MWSQGSPALAQALASSQGFLPAPHVLAVVKPVWSGLLWAVKRAWRAGRGSLSLPPLLPAFLRVYLDAEADVIEHVCMYVAVPRQCADAMIVPWLHAQLSCSRTGFGGCLRATCATTGAPTSGGLFPWIVQWASSTTADTGTRTRHFGSLQLSLADKGMSTRQCVENFKVPATQI